MSRENRQARQWNPELQAGDEPEPRGDAAPEASSVCIPMIGGVVAAGMVLSVFHPSLNPNSLSWGGLLFFATGLLLVATLTSAMVARAVCRMMRSYLPGSVEPIVQATGLGALWVPAWVLGMRYPSVLMVVAACFCLWSVNRAIKRYEAGSGGAGQDSAAGDGSDVLRLPNLHAPIGDSKPLVLLFLPALAVAILAQGAVTAMVLDRYVIGSLVAGGCVAGLVWMSSSKALRERVRRESNRRVMVMRVLAFVFTIIVLLPYLRKPAGMMGFPLLPGVAAAPRAAGPRPGTSSSGFTGIILLPLTKPEKKIVAPVSKGATAAGQRIAEPMVIPFDGVYWYFKAPDSRPQPTAHVVKGSSLKAKVRSTDALPLLMDAHQELGQAIELSCCSRIEIAVQNAEHNVDGRAGAIYLELWLRDKTMPGMMGRYVGTAVIPSSESGGSQGSPGAVTDETLEYSLPAGMRIGKFDEITVGVRTDPMRAREGAQIGIRQFVLYP